MKTLVDIKDSGGIALKAYTDILVEKCREKQLVCVILVSDISPLDPATYFAANIDKRQVPEALRQFANIIAGQPSGSSSVTLTDAEPS